MAPAASWHDRHRCPWRPRPREGARRPGGQGSAQPSRRARIRRALCRKYRTGRGSRHTFSTRVLDASQHRIWASWWSVDKRPFPVNPRTAPLLENRWPRPRQGRILCRHARRLLQTTISLKSSIIAFASTCRSGSAPPIRVDFCPRSEGEPDDTPWAPRGLSQICGASTELGPHPGDLVLVPDGRIGGGRQGARLIGKRKWRGALKDVARSAGRDGRGRFWSQGRRGDPVHPARSR
jgi:hypothetical protein